MERKKEFKDWYNKSDKVEATLFRDQLYKPFGVALMGYEIEFDRFNEVSTACFIFKENKILINVDCPILKEKNGLNFLILHELWHPINMCHERSSNRDHDLWNVADDYCGNLFLKELENLSKQKSNGNSFDLDVESIKMKYGILLNDEFQGMITEEIYDHLKNKATFNKKQ